MKRFPTARSRAALLGTILLCAAPLVTAAEPVNGTVTGSIRNSATGEALGNAIVMVVGSTSRAVTAGNGFYRLSLPPGRHTVSVSFTGLNPVQATVDVAPGGTAESNFELGADIYRMEQFVVRTLREDDAISLQQQRYSATPKIVVATSAHGAPADNPGELLQRLPGISTGLEQGEVGSISIRGMGQEFAKMTVDGESVATSFGNFLSSGREFIVTELATNNLSQIELIRAPTPDNDANSIAGTVNLVTRRYYDRPGRVVQLNATVSGLWRDFDTSPNKSKLGRYGRSSVSYTDSFDVAGRKKNLGLAFDLAWSRVLRAAENTGPQVAGTLTAGYVNPTSANPLPRLFSTSEFGGPIEKLNANLNLDFKVGTSGYVFARVGYTEQDRLIPRYQALTANTPTTVAGFQPGSTFESATVLPQAASQLVTRALNSLRSSEILATSFGGEYTLFDNTTVVNVLGSYSRAASKNPYFVTSSAAVSGIGFSLDRRETSSFEPRLTQTSGPSWSDPRNYRATTLANTVTQGAPTDNYAWRVDLTRHLTSRRNAHLKAGFKFNERISEDRRSPDSWTFVGADGIADSADDSLGSLVGNVFRMGRGGYGPFVFLPMVSQKEQIGNAAWWKKTAAQAYNDLTGAHARGTRIEEASSAGYVLANAQIGPVRALAGVRAERTEVETVTWNRNATASWGGNSVGGASFDPAIVAANIARAERSYIGRQRATSAYTEVFPGAHLVWEPRDALLVRASYNRSIARPSVAQMLPTGSVNDETMRITVGNTALQPYLADNYEISLEKYLEPVGLIGLGAFRKDITRYFRTFSDVVGPEGIDGTGLYAGYERTTARNIGSAKVEGLEISAQQQFRGLPGLLAGLGAFANFTYLRAEGDFGAAAVSRRIPNMTPRTANAGISYVGRGWQIRPLLNWQSRTYRGTSGTLDYDSASRTWLDLKVQYSLSRKYSVELSVFNLTNEAENTLVSSDGRLPFVQIKPGTAYSLGITGRF